MTRVLRRICTSRFCERHLFLHFQAHTASFLFSRKKRIGKIVSRVGKGWNRDRNVTPHASYVHIGERYFDSENRFCFAFHFKRIVSILLPGDFED